jgi:hypothetical protein
MLLSLQVSRMRLLDVGTAAIGVGVLIAACACAPLLAITSNAPTIFRVMGICITNLPRKGLVTRCECDPGRLVRGAMFSGAQMRKARRTANASPESRQFAIVLARCDRNDSRARSTKRCVSEIFAPTSNAPLRCGVQNERTSQTNPANVGVARARLSKRCASETRLATSSRSAPTRAVATPRRRCGEVKCGGRFPLRKPVTHAHHKISGA